MTTTTKVNPIRVGMIVDVLHTRTMQCREVSEWRRGVTVEAILAVRSGIGQVGEFRYADPDGRGRLGYFNTARDEWREAIG